MLMATDIGETLLELITETFENNLKTSRRIAALQKRFGTNYYNVDQYAKEVGILLSKAIHLHVDGDILPDGRMYYNIANTILTDRLTRNHELVSEYALQTQSRLNEAFNIGIKPQKAKLDAQRLHDLVWRIGEAEYYENVADMLKVSVVTFTQSIVTDFIDVNASFQYKSGLRPVLIRSTDGSCCKWCSSVAGVYEYPPKSDDIFARHQSCTCMVTYYPALGSAQDVYSKKFYSTEEGKKVKQEQIALLRMKARK